MRELGLADTEFSNAQFTTRPEYDDKGRPSGRYVASHELQVETRDLTRVGAIVDATLAAGALVRRIRFEAEDISPARERALADAVTMALKDAQVMAKAAGGALGPLIELTTQGSARPPEVGPKAFRAGVVQFETKVTPAELSISVTVLGRWRYVEEAQPN